MPIEVITSALGGMQAEHHALDGVKDYKERGNHLMPLLQVVIVLIVVGVLLWLVNRFIPMEATIKSILNAIVIIAVVLWLLGIFGLFDSMSKVRIGS